MKRAFFGLIAAGLMSAASGCASLYNNCETCDGYGTRACAGGGHGGGAYAGGYGAGGRGGVHPRMAALHGGHHRVASPDFGPGSAAVAYPYYTTRGPRDFFEPAPPSIGR